MNAYELADEFLQHLFYGSFSAEFTAKGKEIVTMLRQQADRIAELEKCAGYYRDKYYLENTHPVKQLSDEEIEEWLDVYALDMGDVYEINKVRFVQAVRAIIKASHG